MPGEARPAQAQARPGHARPGQARLGQARPRQACKGVRTSQTASPNGYLTAQDGQSDPNGLRVALALPVQEQQASGLLKKASKPPVEGLGPLDPTPPQVSCQLAASATMERSCSTKDCF